MTAPSDIAALGGLDAAAAIEDAPTEAVKSRNPLLAMLALAVGGFAIGTTEFAAMTLLPFFAPDLGATKAEAGHIISAYAVGVVVGAPIFAVLGAKLAKRTLLIVLMVLFALGNGLSAIAPDYGSMLLFRFLSGLPHGAYFGVAALVAASLVPPNKRSQAVARVMLGLTVATVVGVPLANALGQYAGWRNGFWVVTALALTCAALVALYAPRDKPDEDAGPLRELRALGRRQVWLTLGIGAVGFGGMFAVYTYLGDTLLEVTQVSGSTLPWVFAVFGLGLTAGTLLFARLADMAQMPAAAGALLWSTLVLALYPLATGNIWTISLLVFLIGCGGGLATVLQTRLMDVAEDAQTLAAALNHSAFNTANALGPWLAGMAIAGGASLSVTGWVGAALAFGGFLIWILAALDARRARAAFPAAAARE